MRAPQEIPRAPDVACPSFQRAVRHLLANLALQAVLCGTLKGNKVSSILQRAPGEKETGRRLRGAAPRGSPHVGRVSGCGSLEGSQPRTPAMGELRRIVREHRPQKVRELLDPLRRRQLPSLSRKSAWRCCSTRVRKPYRMIPSLEWTYTGRGERIPLAHFHDCRSCAGNMRGERRSTKTRWCVEEGIDSG